MQQQIAEIEKVAKGIMSKEALGRYGNLRVAHPEKALQVAIFIAQAASNNQIQGVLSDDDLKNILLNAQEPKKEFKFVRK